MWYHDYSSQYHRNNPASGSLWDCPCFQRAAPADYTYSEGKSLDSVNYLPMADPQSPVLNEVFVRRFLSLPTELIREICLYLPLANAGPLSIGNRFFRDIFKDTNKTPYLQTWFDGAHDSRVVTGIDTRRLIVYALAPFYRTHRPCHWCAKLHRLPEHGALGSLTISPAHSMLLTRPGESLRSCQGSEGHVTFNGAPRSYRAEGFVLWFDHASWIVRNAACNDRPNGALDVLNTIVCGTRDAQAPQTPAMRWKCNARVVKGELIIYSICSFDLVGPDKNGRRLDANRGFYLGLKVPPTCPHTSYTEYHPSLPRTKRLVYTTKSDRTVNLLPLKFWTLLWKQTQKWSCEYCRTDYKSVASDQKYVLESWRNLGKCESPLDERWRQQTQFGFFTTPKPEKCQAYKTGSVRASFKRGK